jgi:hypothetical protein
VGRKSNARPMPWICWSDEIRESLEVRYLGGHVSVRRGLRGKSGGYDPTRHSAHSRHRHHTFASSPEDRCMEFS